MFEEKHSIKPTSFLHNLIQLVTPLYRTSGLDGVQSYEILMENIQAALAKKLDKKVLDSIKQADSIEISNLANWLLRQKLLNLLENSIPEAEKTSAMVGAIQAWVTDTTNKKINFLTSWENTEDPLKKKILGIFSNLSSADEKDEITKLFNQAQENPVANTSINIKSLYKEIVDATTNSIEVNEKHQAQEPILDNINLFITKLGENEISSKGICNGLSFLNMRSRLISQEKEFFSRNERIANLSKDEIIVMAKSYQDWQKDSNRVEILTILRQWEKANPTAKKNKIELEKWLDDPDRKPIKNHIDWFNDGESKHKSIENNKLYSLLKKWQDNPNYQGEKQRRLNAARELYIFTHSTLHAQIHKKDAESGKKIQLDFQQIMRVIPPDQFNPDEFKQTSGIDFYFNDTQLKNYLEKFIAIHHSISIADEGHAMTLYKEKDQDGQERWKLYNPNSPLGYQIFYSTESLIQQIRPKEAASNDHYFLSFNAFTTSKTHTERHSENEIVGSVITKDSLSTLSTEQKDDLLIFATSKNHTTAVKTLLEHGEALHPDLVYWATVYKAKDVMNLLIQQGADPNYKHKDKSVILHAADRGHMDMVLTALESKKPIDKKTLEHLGKHFKKELLHAINEAEPKERRQKLLSSCLSNNNNLGSIFYTKRSFFKPSTSRGVLKEIHDQHEKLAEKKETKSNR